MCGIVGALTNRNIVEILIAALRRLAYRGYDSAGIAVIDDKNELKRARAAGKIDILAEHLKKHPLVGNIGIAHTRWATHGEPSEINAHPHCSKENDLALVHNGIIENYQELQTKLKGAGYQFTSDTDTEVIVHYLHKKIKQGQNFLNAVHEVRQKLIGMYALAIINNKEPKRIIAVRSGSPLVIGLNNGEYFLASDRVALTRLAEKFIYLEEGDLADISLSGVTIYDKNLKKVTRQVHAAQNLQDSVDRGEYKHYMAKEIFEQPQALAATIAGRIEQNSVAEKVFGDDATAIFARTKAVQIVACGTSYHAGLTARYWLEEFARIPCKVEIASEIRYRQAAVQKDTLFIAISQSGETADTLAAMHQAKELGYLANLAICNVDESSLMRQANLKLLTRAGLEIGVASTKAFTTQLAALLLLVLALGATQKAIDEKTAARLCSALKHLPSVVEETLTLNSTIQNLAAQFIAKNHALFLGRGINYATALEGALKMKEISYIHAEAYPAGELKHGPLALVDRNMPVIVIAPNDELTPKLLSNVAEVAARGGELFIFADEKVKLPNISNITTIKMPAVAREIAPIVYTVPLQLLAYHVAVLKGTDVDQPRNLAKSVTVE